MKQKKNTTNQKKVNRKITSADLLQIIKWFQKFQIQISSWPAFNDLTLLEEHIRYMDLVISGKNGNGEKIKTLNAECSVSNIQCCGEEEEKFYDAHDLALLEKPFFKVYLCFLRLENIDSKDDRVRGYYYPDDSAIVYGCNSACPLNRPGVDAHSFHCFRYCEESNFRKTNKFLKTLLEILKKNRES